MLIEVAIPADRNVIKREVENIFEYKDLITEIQHMWNVTAKVIIGTTGTNPKSLRQYLSNTAGRHEIKKLTKNFTHSMESANVKVQNIFHERNKMTCRKTVNTKQLQHSVL
jgi:hypothetical protein